MTRARFLGVLAVLALLAALFFNPAPVSAVRSSQQTTGDITAQGQICGPYSPECGEFSITFNPAGGPVTGSVYVDWSITDMNSGQKIGDEVLQGTLTGTFAGGDGGLVTGSMATGTVTITYLIECETCINETQSAVGSPWEGHLRADGTGNGWIGPTDVLWNVTYSPQDFQAGPAAPIPTEVPIPTLASFPTETPAEDNGMVDLVVGPSSVVVKSWPDLIAAIAEITNQDDAIVARDEQGVYYVIDNQGNQKALPAELQSVLQMNNEFGLLQNAQLLWASPAVQAFVAANGNDAMDAITGNGKYQYYTIPEWLKQRQYLKTTTQCGNGDCSPYTTISVLESSLYFPQQAFASSEHSSVRGTINGGGDFIYDPFPANGVKLASLSYVPRGGLQNTGDRPYLGVQVLDATDRAYIQMVQRGSPADEAGLAVDDQIVSVSGTYLDDTQNTLAALIGQHSGGDQVELGVIRLGETGVTPITVTLATMLPPVIVTPSAEITVSDDTEFVVDIGLNGVTGVLVLADTAHVREPVTGSEVDVPAGSAVIVVPGYEIGSPIAVSADQVNAWWSGGQPVPLPTSVPPNPPTPSPNILPITDSRLILGALLFLCLCVVVVIVVAVIIIVSRRRKH